MTIYKILESERLSEMRRFEMLLSLPMLLFAGSFYLQGLDYPAFALIFWANLVFGTFLIGRGVITFFQSTGDVNDRAIIQTRNSAAFFVPGRPTVYLRRSDCRGYLPHARALVTHDGRTQPIIGPPGLKKTFSDENIIDCFLCHWWPGVHLHVVRRAESESRDLGFRCLVWLYIFLGCSLLVALFQIVANGTLMFFWVPAALAPLSLGLHIILRKRTKPFEFALPLDPDGLYGQASSFE